MGGLVAARVLADFYEHVTVVERDVLPPDAANRRGVPQGRHVHALLGRGSQALAELFPGLTDEVILKIAYNASGTAPADSNGIWCAPDTVREIGGTVRERCPPPVDPRVSDRWLPVRGAGTPPSVGNRS